MNGGARKSRRDASLNAARYQLERATREGLPEDEYAERTGRSDPQAKTRVPREIHADDEVWKVANHAVDEAIAHGDFDNLPLAGQAIDHITGNTNPDWWLKGLLQREKITGLGPAALTLRVEDQQLEQILDGLPGETQVREHLEDFNRRIIEARRQLQGGPPVVTPLREVEQELASWRARRRSRVGSAAGGQPQDAPRRRWWQRKAQ